MKGKTVYLHTINDKPAAYYPNEQICYLRHGSKVHFCKSLKQIRAEQKRSIAWRTKRGFSSWPAEYGYLRLIIQ